MRMDLASSTLYQSAQILKMIYLQVPSFPSCTWERGLNSSRLDKRGATRLADSTMARETQRFWLTFDGDSSRKPLIYEMSKKFEVIFNVRNASVTPTIGIIALEMEGDREEIKKAVAWFEANGVQVEPVEINTIEG